MKIEYWKPVPGYEGLYWVSDLGNVKSLNYNHTGEEQILRPRKGTGGYLKVLLCKNGKKKNCYVHRLVWEAFNGPIPKGMQINHLNEDKTDNRLENLSLMTPKQNLNYGTRNVRAAKTKSKKVEQFMLDGTHICTWFSTIEIERELGYANQNISSCCRGKRKTAYGYIWKYA